MRTKRITVNGSDRIVYEDGHSVPAQDRYFLSTEEKPIEGVPNSEFCIEMDTGKVFTFDEENKTWLPM